MRVPSLCFVFMAFLKRFTNNEGHKLGAMLLLISRNSGYPNNKGTFGRREVCMICGGGRGGESRSSFTYRCLKAGVVIIIIILSSANRSKVD